VTGYDFGIIGAGAHGASVAYHLSRRGHSVVMFERGERVSGPTSQASGVVRSYYTNQFLAEIAHESTAVLADFESRVGGDSGYVRTGGLYLHAAADRAEVHSTAEGLRAVGVVHEVYDSAGLSECFRELRLDDVAIGVWEEHAGYADPYRTALSYLSRAAENGTTLLEYSPVQAITDNGPSVHVTLADGTVHEVARLLVAAGPWTGPLVAQVGMQLPLTAERHIVTGLVHRAGDTERAVPHVLIDVAAGYYSRPAAQGRFLLGPLTQTVDTDPDHFDDGVSAAEFEWLHGRAAERAPIRAAAVPDRSWASLYDVSPDWQPVIGQISDRVYVDAGTSGHGFKLSPTLGDHVARLLLDEPDPRLAQFSPDRFSAGAGLSSGFGAARILG
jgi:sarcosine oxidase, subunit beta